MLEPPPTPPSVPNGTASALPVTPPRAKRPPGLRSANLPHRHPTIDTNGDAFTFTDHERDSENGTDATLYRHYASWQGRWLSPDPSNGSYNLLDPQSLNRYSYLTNRPMAQVDRLGLDGDDDDDDDDDDGGWWSDFWDDVGSWFGSGNSDTGGSSQDWGVPSVASGGAAGTTQPNAGPAYVNATLYYNGSTGAATGSWQMVDFSPGADQDGLSEIPSAFTSELQPLLSIAPGSIPRGGTEPLSTTAGMIAAETLSMRDTATAKLSDAQALMAHQRINAERAYGKNLAKYAGAMTDLVTSGSAYDRVLGATLAAAKEDIAGNDPTRGATQYNMRTPSQNDAMGDKAPPWAKGMIVHTRSGPFPSWKGPQYILTYGPKE